MDAKRREVISYLFFGVLTTAVNLLSYLFFTKVLHFDYKVATTIAWIISVLFAFITNKLFVFRSHHKDKRTVMKEFVSFVAFRWLSYLLDLFSMILLVSVLRVDDLVAKLIANVFVVIFNYFASKFIVFKR
ncbi:GtrA family protein [Bacillus sp. PS06]|uniref:GtrA family protein n=1 Tax=Bacillus sp. PS06 TaxID=2764176 RepID=UPI001782564B|nr:GtrA family protein [Bacillus sp. PS06]MBD8071150.1 GtrA family protein [Bacillus sp. PS06]